MLWNEPDSEDNRQLFFFLAHACRASLDAPKKVSADRVNAVTMLYQHPMNTELDHCLANVPGLGGAGLARKKVLEDLKLLPAFLEALRTFA